MTLRRQTATKPKEKNNSSSIFQGRSERILIADTFILAAVPIAAYLLVFSYETGYFSIFQIPIEFASFDLPRIFIAILAVVTIAISAYYIGDFLREMSSSRPEPIRRRIDYLIFVNMVIFIYLYITSPDWRVWLFTVLAMLLFSSASFLAPLFTEKQVKGYLAKLRAADRARKKRRRAEWPNLLQRLAFIVGRQTVVAMIIFAGALFISFEIGRSEAEQQKTFRVVSTSPERVVLWIVGDHMICSTFDRSLKQIDPSFVVLDLGKDPQLEYRREQLGPLTVKTNAENPTTPVTPMFTPSVPQPSMIAPTNLVQTSVP